MLLELVSSSLHSGIQIGKLKSNINVVSWQSQFGRGDTVQIRSIVDRLVIGMGEVIGLPGEDRFHSVSFESPYVRVLVTEVFCPDVALPFPNPEEGHKYLKNMLGMNTLWSARYLRKLV